MFIDVSKAITISFQWWKANPHADLEAPYVAGSGNAFQILENGWDTWPLTKELGGALLRAQAKCRPCRRILASNMENQELHTQAEVRLKSSGGGDEDYSQESSGDEKEQKIKKKQQALRNRRKKTPYTGPRQSTAVDLIPLTVPPYRPIFLRNRMYHQPFDDYYNGPTLEDNPTIPIAIINFPLHPYGQRTESSVWTQYRDYGFRYERSFYQTFNKEQAIKAIEHFLPVPARPTAAIPTSTASLGLQEVLQHLEDRGKLVVKAPTKANIDIFLCGRLPEEDGEDQTMDDSDLFTIDPALDGLDSVQVKISVDIDSLIWVTHDLQFRLPVKLLIGLTFNQDAPISKHNHVYVHILPPRANREAAQEFIPIPVSLSAMPHMRFIQAGGGAGSFNTSIHFPRMKHKREFSNRTVSTVPSIVQQLFLNRVLLPAIQATVDQSATPYVQYTLSDFAWKAEKSGQATMKSIPILPNQLKQLQKVMRALIQANTDLDLFGSFFFVTDGRGFKLWTMDGAGIPEAQGQAVKALAKIAPFMDWEYAQNRRNGELYLDVGIGFQPIGVEGEGQGSDGIVGIWKLDKLRQSYGQAGYESPKIHRTSTFRDYGNVQAEMQPDRSRGTHIVFRQDYNLAYEVVRTSSNNFNICDESVAYCGNRAYTDAVGQMIRAFDNASGKSFGVRSEIRLGVRGLIAVFPSVNQLVRVSLLMIDIHTHQFI